MNQPPEIPGSGRLKRAAAASGSSAYQAVFEAVGSILLACGVGFWVDRRFETGPLGVLLGAAIGFGAFVLRLMRLGKELHPVDESQASGRPDPTDREAMEAVKAVKVADDLAIGEAPGLSPVLREDSGADLERDEKAAPERSDASDSESNAGTDPEEK